MRQLILRGGSVRVEDVPAPRVEPGTVLVSVAYSCISVGTEIAGVRSSALPVWRRALSRRDEAKQVLGMMAKQGVRRIHRMVKAKVTSGSALGYSAAGTVLEVGDGISDVRKGDVVACSGAQCAHHAEVIRAPRNLISKVPEGLDLSSASSVTLGTIALQGVRRLAPTMGETFVVLGLGILGQVTVQLLKANGCRVVGLDLDHRRVSLAKESGADAVCHSEGDDVVEHIHRLTDGYGADGVVVTAATDEDTLISQAFQMCRRKGRVVLVGDVGLNLKRKDLYDKELDFLISTSYGPGRYDPTYEQLGIDYPISYVRWAENRNMGEFIRLLAEKRVELGHLISRIVDIDDAGQAYAELRDGSHDLMVLLRYPERDGATASLSRTATPAQRRCPNALRVALIGAGSFAKGVHLPNIEALPRRYRLHAVMSHTGHNAQMTARQFGAVYATTDLSQIICDPDIDALIVTTRHNLHARIALEGLRAGKHVIVEKPLALTREETEEILAFYSSNPQGPLLMTGYNRRFSPHAKRVLEIVSGRSNPMIVSYQMNAGYVPLDSWVHGEEGGGRNLGEACHIYDLFTFLTGACVEEITTQAIRPATNHYASTDNFVASMRFADGSVATLTYTALGCGAHPKEHMVIYVDGMVLVLDDYRTLAVRGPKGKGLKTRIVDKGHKQELLEFSNCLLEGTEWPIPLWQQIQATDIALRVQAQISE